MILKIDINEAIMSNGYGLLKFIYRKESINDAVKNGRLDILMNFHREDKNNIRSIYSLKKSLHRYHLSSPSLCSRL